MFFYNSPNHCFLQIAESLQHADVYMTCDITGILEHNSLTAYFQPVVSITKRELSAWRD
jgi:hypothetical protein